MNRLFAFLITSTLYWGASAIAATPFSTLQRDTIEAHDEDYGEDEVIDEDDLERGVKTIRSTQAAPTAPTTTVPTEGMVRGEANNLNAWYTREYMRFDTTKPNGPNPETTTLQYIDRLRRLPTLIEMPYNDIVRGYLDQYTQKLRPSVSFMLGAQNFYNPIFEEALEAQGLPLELKYLPVVESSLDPTAVSPAGAAGLWQFMVPVAQHYGLTVNSLVDERRDPVLSSQAAARYLKHLFAEFGDWTLALAAYNSGPTNVRKAITRAKGSRDYWKIYPYLPKETRGYVPAFIAANYVMRFYCEHNIAPMVSIAPIATDTVMIDRDLSLEQVAALCNLSTESLMAMNPQYRTGVVPGYSQASSLRLPEKVIAYFLELGDSVYNYQADRFLAKRTMVEAAERDNETNMREVETVAPVVKTPVAPRDFQTRRREERKSRTAPPSKETAKTPKETATPKAEEEKPTRVSRRSKTEEEKNTRSSRSKKEEEVETKTSRKKRKTQDEVEEPKSKRRKSKRSKKSEPAEVSVKKGQTLEEIAKKNGTTVEKLRKANKIKGDMIKPGEKLKLK